MPTFFESSAGFRAWLARNADSADELEVGYYKSESGQKSITWSESVDEALCFGWIDGVRTRIDERSYKIRFTPRRPDSIWSAINIEKVRVLEAAGRMTPAGLAAFARRDKNKSRTYSYEQAKVAELDLDQTREFKRHKAAWSHFQAEPPSYRHMAAWYVISAKRPETREARLEKVIAASARRQRI
jgi:uncharacterized protein YdeI (YjbR/CyaY-like superfamily)